MNWEFFFRQLEAGMNINETCFYFSDDPNEFEHYIGFIEGREKPYWVGYCDIENGCEFPSAFDLVNAPIFDRKTLKDRWNHVKLCSIEGTCIEDWLKYFHHV